MNAITKLIKELNASLSAPLAAYGFRYDAKPGWFVRDFDGGRQIIGLNVARFTAEIHVAAHIAVRFHALASLIADLRDDLDEELKPGMASLGCELGNLQRGKREVWIVRWASDIPQAVSGIMGLLRAVGFHFLEKYSSLDEAFDAFKRDDKEARRVQGFMHVRAENAVGIAFLRGDRPLFEELESYKTRVLEEAKDFGRREYLQIVDKLRQRFPPTA
jgi:hypothetical protein